ncbi:flagellin [Natronobacterium texcoconense]|uniref:Flagellar protein FlaF n=1 Tax=Natronobacterium texcoconense TaxID=1095778 RepID=A0A1H1IM44_NATTX|nr:flagellin [Natronobacterium texcoconense]SDR38416.1 flagellar protein FlaF [Natronobacterium texcoconense]
MGFSTSAAAAIMLIAFLVAAGVIFPAIFTVSADTGDAFAAQAEQNRDQANTDIDVLPYETDGGDLTVTVENEGTTSLTVTDTDLLVNGQFVQPDETAVVDENEDEDDDVYTETDIWVPGTTLELTIYEETLSENGIDDPERVKIVTETGIADATMEET